MQTETPDERTVMIRDAIKACFAAREAANLVNVKAKLPSDFWTDFDTGKELSDEDAFHEIQSTFTAHIQPPVERENPMLIKTDPAGHPLRPVEPFPDYLPPSDKVVEPVEPIETTAAPVVEENTASDGASGPGPSPQERLDAARRIEGDLIGEQHSLRHAQQSARGVLNDAKVAYAHLDPNRETPVQLSASYRKASQEQRAARARGEKWAVPPERKPRGQRAYVDVARAYSTGGDGNDFARRQNRTGDRRGAFPSTFKNQINTDPSRGNVPKPVEPPRPTVPLLAK